MSRQVYQRLDNKVLRIAKQRESRLRKSYQGSLNNLRAYFSGMVDRFGNSDGTIDFAELNKRGRFNSARNEIVRQGDLLYESMLDDIKDDLREVYELSYSTTAGAIERTTGTAVAGKLRLDALEKAINAPVGGLTIDLRLDELRLNIENRLTRSITSGISQGKKWTDISKDLRKDFEGNLSSLQRIVRTEGHRLEETAKYDVAKKSRKPLAKEWVSERDNRVREWHQELDGTVVGLDENFESSVGGSGLFPGEMGVPEDDINCRCFVNYVEVEEGA